MSNMKKQEEAARLEKTNRVLGTLYESEVLEVIQVGDIKVYIYAHNHHRTFSWAARNEENLVIEWCQEHKDLELVRKDCEDYCKNPYSIFDAPAS